MARKFYGTEVQKPKDIAAIKNITVRRARTWLKETRLRIGMKENEDFTLRHFSKAENIALPELLNMLNGDIT